MLLIGLSLIGLIAVATLTVEKVESIPVPVRVERTDLRQRKYFHR